MTKTRDNHYVPQWYQKGFMDERDNQLCHLTRREIAMPNGELKVIDSKKWHTSTQRFYAVDLYSTFLGEEVSDEIEKELFGPIDDNGSKSIKAFLKNDSSQWHIYFRDLFIYLDAQKLRTPKGLDWIKSKYSTLTQEQLMSEMKALRNIHCTLWVEGVRELVSASTSKVKFITSDHPVTIYNYACPPGSDACNYPNDPDISLKGSQTIFPLDKNRCLILTNLEYAQNPENVDPLEQRTNPTRLRNTLVNSINFIKSRELTEDEVTKINYIIKKRSKDSIASGREEWLYPDKNISCKWSDLKYVLLPPSHKVCEFSGEMVVHYDNGNVIYQDALGRSMPSNEFLSKNIDERKLGRNDLCGCGSGRKYKHCCLNVPINYRTTWKEASIRERNLAFCKCIRVVLDIGNDEQALLDIRKVITAEKVKEIYEFYSVLWPRETNVYSLLPKSNCKFRALYSGLLDIRPLFSNILPIASLFDEFLVVSPISNPSIFKEEFNPIEHPETYIYQALKEFLFILALEPFIGIGLVNLIPAPNEFDLELMRGMLDFSSENNFLEKIQCKYDLDICSQMMLEDQLNIMVMMPMAVKVNTLKDMFDLDEVTAKKIISELDKKILDSPLALCNTIHSGKGGQFIQSRIEPNYEMSLFIAQVTGSIIVTDNSSRWQQFTLTQQCDDGLAQSPWEYAFNKLKSLPIDYDFLITYSKSQGCFSMVRNTLRLMDEMMLSNNRNDVLSQSVKLEEELSKNTKISFKKFSVCAPLGGIYNANVNRLLARSSCLQYDRQVRAIWGIDLPQIE